jgi:TM2 domain-containing membrane protein YozV
MLKQFFILCSGADKNTLETCSEGEQTKFTGIGATVFFTAVMAFIASSYALFTVFDNPYIAMGFGLVWGLLIFNLDRFIVSTIRKTNVFWSEFGQAAPRIILAIIIAIVISKPLEIKIFEKEINTVLLKEKNAMAIKNKKEISNYFQSDLDKNKSESDNLKVQISNKEKEVNAYYETYIAEAEGTAGTKKLGKGPVFREKIAKHNLAKKELDSLQKTNATKIAENETKSKKLQDNLDKKVTESQPIIDNFDGLMARINALNKLPLLPSLFIMLLFLAIELSPIITKLLSPKGEYDYKLEDLEDALKSNIAQDKQQRNLLLETNAKMHSKVYVDVSEEKKLHDLQRKNASDVLEHKSNNFASRYKAGEY